MASSIDDLPKHHVPTQNEKLVITASSLGTVFEWYDFYLYGLMATFISKVFFAGVNETTGFILALGAFAAGVRADRRSGRAQKHLPSHHGHYGPFHLRGRPVAGL